MKRLLSFIGLLFLISCFIIGCQNNSTTPMENNQIELSNLNANNQLDQQRALEAKQLVSSFDEVSHVTATNSESELIIAFEVNHFERLKLKSIKKKIKQKLEKEFNDLEISLSTDKKIIIELNKLEQLIQTNKLNKTELEKQMKRIAKLAEEQT